MPRLLERLFGPRRPVRDYHRGPELAGLDALTQRAIELQKRYWRPNPAELAELEAAGLAALDWAQKLRLHHLRCLALLDSGAGQDAGRLRQALLDPADERPEAAPSTPEGQAAAAAAVAASAKALLGRRSPYRPRHGFAWLGAAAPEGEDIPYSDFQGRVVNASLTHLGALEVIGLDEALEPASLDFVPFDEILTLSRAPLATGPGEVPPPFVPARVLREYGLEDLVVLLPGRYGLSWLSFDEAVLRGAGAHGVGSVSLSGLADPSKAIGNPHDRRELALRVGPQQLEILSDYAEEGLGRFGLGAAYQLSLAIDQDDPRFVDKCEGRGLDPKATRGDVVRESRLRASAKAARKSQ